MPDSDSPSPESESELESVGLLDTPLRNPDVDVGSGGVVVVHGGTVVVVV